MPKDDEGFLITGADPAVLDLLQAGQRRRGERAMPREERKRVKKAQEKQAARKRAVYDLPEDLIDAIQDIGRSHRVPASQVAMIALRYFLESDVDISKFKVVSETKSPIYDFRLVWDEEKIKNLP